MHCIALHYLLHYKSEFRTRQGGVDYETWPRQHLSSTWLMINCIWLARNHMVLSDYLGKITLRLFNRILKSSRAARAERSYPTWKPLRLTYFVDIQHPSSTSSVFTSVCLSILGICLSSITTSPALSANLNTEEVVAQTPRSLVAFFNNITDRKFQKDLFFSRYGSWFTVFITSQVLVQCL